MKSKCVSSMLVADLFNSCINEEDTARPPPCPAWVAIPAAQLTCRPPEQRTDGYVPPVNYRLQNSSRNAPA